MKTIVPVNDKLLHNMVRQWKQTKKKHIHTHEKWALFRLYKENQYILTYHPKPGSFFRLSPF